MKPFDITSIANRIAMPVVKSNVPLDSIQDYIGILQKVDIPINLYISDVNPVPPTTTVLVDIKHLDMQFDHYIDESIDEQRAIKIREELEKFKASLDPEAINIITNRSSSNEGSAAGPDWLAHDLYHVVEQEYTPESVSEFVAEDIEVYDSETGEQRPSSSLTWQVYESLFFYWLPKTFKDKAPAYGLNIRDNKIWDIFPDIMISYLNDPSTPRNIKLEYKPAWQDALGYLKSRRPVDASTVIIPKAGADSTAIMVDLIIEETYNKIRSMFESFRGKIVIIG